MKTFHHNWGGGYTKSEVDTLLNDYIPKSGGGVFNGVVYSKNTSDSLLQLIGGTAYNTGAYIALYGKEHSTKGGQIECSCRKADGTAVILNFRPDGTAEWDGKNLAMQEDTIPRSGGAVFTGGNISRIDDTGMLAIRGGSGYDKGAQLTLYGKDVPNYDGYATLHASNGTNISELTLRPNSYTTILCAAFLPQKNSALYPTLGNAEYKWGQFYSTNSTISTSDSRLKNTITNIDDSLLDAWESIQPKQYKFNDATETKGDQARFHTGYLAQDIQKACTDNNIDATRYGLFCYDSWEEEPEITEDVEVEKDGVKTTEKRIIQPKREKGDAYSLRYEETLVVECAYLRREISRLKEELNQLKTK